MRSYMKKHEGFVKEELNKDLSTEEWFRLKDYHEKQINFIQHERLIHLLVTLAFAMFFLISVLYTLSHSFNKEVLAMDILFLILLVPYIFHYFALENGIQRWYNLYNQICSQTSNIKVNCEKK